MSEISKNTVRGASPAGAHDAQAASAAVRAMFTAIAPRYDLLNHLLSLNVDRLWWRRAARAFVHILSRPNARVLDICCGTGDMAFALRRAAGTSQIDIMGADFSHAMLRRACEKSGHKQVRWIEADALRLPFPNHCFDLLTAAFGFRNLADYDAGLREIVRVLKPGAECGILDFAEPPGKLGKAYQIYFRHVLPRVGTAISGVRGPYLYLPASVERFPQPDQIVMRMRSNGFSEAHWTAYTYGIAVFYRGRT
ncbi:MAG: ubiquinone/menaquinone biosynthesis methyltransferase [Acidobacteria bacterium]|nr:ubiquinone/menaquinone biosynthesis methyltransferase [Acidobacteriota bacterium]